MTDAKGLSEVHRYGVYPVNRGSVAQTRPERDGAYVLHADYAALAEKLAACEQQLNIREIVTPIRESYIRRGIDGDWAEVVGRLKADLARLTAERDRLRAAVEAGICRYAEMYEQLSLGTAAESVWLQQAQAALGKPTP